MAAVMGRASHTLGVVTFSLIAVLLRKEALLLLPVHVGIFLDGPEDSPVLQTSVRA